MHEHLETLHIACNTILDVVSGAPCAQALRRLHEADMFSTEIACQIVESVTTGRFSPAADTHADYLAVTNSPAILSSRVEGDVEQIMSQCSKSKRHMLSLKPKVVRKSTQQMKEEMMKKYEKGGYYFLEEYLDGMLETPAAQLY